METSAAASRTEGQRLLSVAEKLLQEKELSGARDFALLAQETHPSLDGSDKILAVIQVLAAAENKKLTNNRLNWYAILQIPQRTDDTDLIKKQYRKLALLLHPDKNKFPLADSAFRHVADAWWNLSDSGRKSIYDREVVARYTKVVLGNQNSKNNTKKQKIQQNKRSNAGGRDNSGKRATNFWTACPYCYNLFEYPSMYLGCQLRCDNESCKRDFTGREIKSMPPLVSGREAYYWSSSFFPVGSAVGSSDDNANAFKTKSMPPTFDWVAENYRVPPQGRGGPTPNVVEIGGRGGGLGLSGRRKRGRSNQASLGTMNEE